VAAYAEFADVVARAGKFAAALASDDRSPNEGDVEFFLTDIAAQIDALLLARGYSPAEISAEARAALKGTNADGALVMAIEALDPLGAAEVKFQGSTLLSGARKRYEAAVVALAEGKHPAIRMLEAGQSGGGQSASSTWDHAAASVAEADRESDLSLLPRIQRGMRL
jgi:hypothetical protein